MIIKSMSRKDLSFYQLVKYFEKDSIECYYSHNLYSNINNNEEIIQEFMQNAEYISGARGKNTMYHEVLSLQTNNLSLQRQKEILEELSNEYVNKRASEHLVYGVIHQDTDHMHMHLMISSNKVAENKRERLTTKEFNEIKKELELYKNKQYINELEPTFMYQNQKIKQKEKRCEQEIKHRRKKQTKKEFVKEQLEKTFNRSMSQKALENSLKAQGFEIYSRGKTTGIVFENKKYRFKTLDLEQEYTKLQTKFKKKEQRQEKRQEFKQEKTKNKTQTKSKTRKQFQEQTMELWKKYRRR